MHPPRIPHASTRISALFQPPPFLSHLHRPAVPKYLPSSLLHQTPSRPASHASEGRANKGHQGPGKRLGAKRAASEHVVPGNIIFRQRGTHWFPGENCGMGRDHTIFAREKGYVVFYREKWRVRGKPGGGERKFIGVVFERGMELPRRPGGKRMRRFGLVGREREEGDLGVTMDGGADAGGAGEMVPPVKEVEGDGLTTAGSESTIRQQTKEQRMQVPQTKSKMKQEGYPPQDPTKIKTGHQFRETNWAIGRSAERAGVKVREYSRGDRWLAWRKRAASKQRHREKKALGGKKVKVTKT